MTKKAIFGPPGAEVSFEVLGCDTCPYGPIIPGQEYCLKMEMGPLTPEDKNPYPDWCPLEDWQ
jgi:hypothetical protein